MALYVQSNTVFKAPSLVHVFKNLDHLIDGVPSELDHQYEHILDYLLVTGIHKFSNPAANCYIGNGSKVESYGFVN